MRIVSGKFSGRTLFTFEGQDIRPTPDKVREAFFSIIQNRVYGSSFLDLFCGTGAMGIEALSRGAKIVQFNDSDRKSIELTKKNLIKVKAEGGYLITNQDAIALTSNTKEKFDIIYIDPPYKAGLNQKAVSSAINCLNDGGVIVLEGETEFECEIDGLNITDKRKYGRVRLTFFERG